MITKYLTLFLLCATIVGLLPVAGQTEEFSTHLVSDQSTKELLEKIRKDARKDFRSTADTLRTLEPGRMNAENHATWVRLSRETAVRNGDVEILKALKRQADPFSLRPLSHILLANAYINEADFSAAHAELGKIGDLERINARDRRRYWALKARLARLEDNVVDERSAVEYIVHELAHWPSADCQSCHNDLKDPQTIPLLEIQGTWYGKRFVDLMKKMGDADAVRQRAKIKLDTTPGDKDARIVLGFALQAMGEQEEAEKSWREIPWIVFPERLGSTGVTTRMMFAWP